MKKVITSLVVLSVIACPFIQPANADTVEIKAYSAGDGDVLLLPSTTTTTYKVLNDGAFVKSGEVLTLTNKKTITLPAEISPGMLFSSTGEVIGTEAVLMDKGKIKIKTREGKTIIKYDD